MSWGGIIDLFNKIYFAIYYNKKTDRFTIFIPYTVKTIIFFQNLFIFNLDGWKLKLKIFFSKNFDFFF